MYFKKNSRKFAEELKPPYQPFYPTLDVKSKTSQGSSKAKIMESNEEASPCISETTSGSQVTLTSPPVAQ